jgi:hypothetical protein
VALLRTYVSERNLEPDDGGDKFLRNVGSYKRTHGATSQKTPLFVVTAVKTSNLAKASLLVITGPLIEWRSY